VGAAANTACTDIDECSGNPCDGVDTAATCAQTDAGGAPAVNSFMCTCPSAGCGVVGAAANTACTVVSGLAVDIQDLSHLKIELAKSEAGNGCTGPIADWNVEAVKSMNQLFYGNNVFNEAIGSWDVGQVTDMEKMFDGNRAFNGDIGTWDVGQVTNMYGMFQYASVFNGDIGTWDVAEVTDMNSMFAKTLAFNSDIGTWDVAEVTIMSYMFYGSDMVFDRDLTNWDVGKVTKMDQIKGLPNMPNFV